jgi:glycine dehydrogenase subunit 2
MKYNPKVNEVCAAMPGFRDHHPHAPVSDSQGSLELLHRLQQQLGEISGFPSVSLQPAAGAQGELAGVLMIRGYHRDREDFGRTKILIPDSAHGTNPASVSMAGFTAVEVPSDSRGNVDLAALRELCDESVAGLMITNPNTLGLFEERIESIVSILHEAGGLVYGDGANLNAILGVLKPGDLDIDVMHFNLHKTFSTPHGGGGPGSGPVGAGPRLVDYLPGPIVDFRNGRYEPFVPERSIGKLKSFYGNFAMVVRAYAYIAAHGPEGLRSVAENAVLNANYLRSLVAAILPTKYDRQCMHEFVSPGKFANEITTMDVAKRLIDYGYHPPTVHFPLIIKDALMVEPTETESRETLEGFAEALHAIHREATSNPDVFHSAPESTPVGRLDEVQAARHPCLTDRDIERA